MVSYDTFRLYDADNDREHNFENTSALKRWLEIHEAEHEGWTGLQSQIIAEALPDAIKSWSEDQGD